MPGVEEFVYRNSHRGERGVNLAELPVEPSSRR